MEISRRIDYGIRVILDLVALPPETRVPSEEIALRQQIPSPFLAKIISQLSLSGLITTYRGPSGGVQLARSPAEISLLQVIEALEGPIRLNRCTTQPDLCPLNDRCPVRDIWVKAQGELVDLLAETTFDRLAQRKDGRGGAGEIGMTDDGAMVFRNSNPLKRQTGTCRFQNKAERK